jgi:protein SCO1
MPPVKLIFVLGMLGMHVLVAAADHARTGEGDRAFEKRTFEKRTHYPSGRLYEVRHFVDGREEGLQQAWTEDGRLYINYEMRNGRRYGVINPRPCPAATAKPGAGAAAGLPYYDDADFTPRWRPVTHEIANFQLIAQDGRPIRRGDLRGRVHIASFIFTQCAGICPSVIARLGKLHAALATRPDAVLLSFSVTPDADTPATLAAFGAARGIDPARWKLVTGDAAQIDRLARGSYFADDDRQASHTEKALLVDRRGHLRGVYNATLPYEIDKLLTDLDALLQSGE